MMKEKIKVYFKKHSFRLDPKANLYIIDALNKVDVDKHHIILERIINELLKQELDSDLITLDTIKITVKNLTSSGTVTLFQVIDAFKVPILNYDGEMKKFHSQELNNIKQVSRLFSDKDHDKSNILKERYNMIAERLIRNDILSFNTCEGDQIGLKTVEYLLSSGAKMSKVMVLGMLTQHHEGVWCLEDVSGIIRINIDNTTYHKGLVLEGSFVLAEGIYEDRIFKVSTLGLPPLESAQMSRNSIFSRTNHFGGEPSNGTVKLCPQIAKVANKDMSGKSLVFISEIWLDREIIFSKLETLFSGYASLKPGAFIFCGNFLSPDMCTSSDAAKLKTLKRAMKRIVLLFATFRELALNSHLVFIPGPNDPFQSNRNVLPRASLPQHILLDHIFNATIPNFKDSEKADLKERVIMASNPCRLTYYNKEIIVFRDNIGQKIYRHCMFIPSKDQEMPGQESQHVDDSLNMSANNTMMDDSELDRDPESRSSQPNFLENQLIWTLLSQAHLMPLPLHVSPVYWGYDHSLRLFPIPDLVLLADPAVATFDLAVNDCLFVNPPSFSTTDGFNFKIYYPYNDKMEGCSLDI